MFQQKLDKMCYNRQARLIRKGKYKKAQNILVLLIQVYKIFYKRK